MHVFENKAHRALISLHLLLTNLHTASSPTMSMKRIVTPSCEVAIPADEACPSWALTRSPFIMNSMT